MKIDKWSQHEGMDRAHMMICMLQEAFGGDPWDEDHCHPALYNDKCKELAARIGSYLCDLYQAIGEWEENE